MAKAKTRRRKRKATRRRYEAKPTMPVYHFRVRLPHTVIDPERKWYAAKTSLRLERRVCADLAEIGLLPYLPLATRTMLRCHRAIEVERNMLPGYLFAGAPEAVDAFSAFGAYNHAEFRKTHQRPILAVYGPIAAAELQAFVDHASAEPEAAEPTAFAPGQRIVIEDGPFQWLTAIVWAIHNNVVRADVNLLGRRTPVTFDASQLRAA